MNIFFREQKIERLCRVVGNDFPQDPDETYELTTDNVKKMMAIYMRFRYIIFIEICNLINFIRFINQDKCNGPVTFNGEFIN